MYTTPHSMRVLTQLHKNLDPIKNWIQKGGSIVGFLGSNLSDIY